ncbi:MAG: PH domain-containing protein [Micromonosporaceae bacterium]
MKTRVSSADATRLMLRPRTSGLAPWIVLGVIAIGFAGSGARVGNWIVTVVGALSLALVIVGVARTRVGAEIGPDGVRRSSGFGRELIAWSEIARVMTGPPRALILIRRDGRMVGLPNVVGWRPDGSRVSLEQAVAVIEAELARHRPESAGPAEAAPLTIERRLAWKPVLAMIIMLGAMGGAVAVGAVLASPWLGLLAAFFFGLAAWLVWVTAASGTVIGPDGIHNRGPVRTLFIPWSEIAAVTGMESPPRVVQIVRRDGTRTIMAAIRDGDVASDGLAFDDVVEVIRQRAGVESLGLPQTPVELAEAPATPFSLRPSRRPLWWLLPAAAACLVLSYLAFRSEAWMVYFAHPVAPAILFALLALKLSRGRTEAGPDGLRNRMMVRTMTIDWADVDRFVITPTMFGRVLQVARKTGKQISLAAPREGLLAREPEFQAYAEKMRALAAQRTPEPPAITEPVSQRAMRIVYSIPLVIVLAMTLFLTRPWLEPWWPGQHVATTLPHACAVTEDIAPQLVSNGVAEVNDHQQDSGAGDSYCAWRNRHGVSLTVGIQLWDRASDQSATALAREDFDSEREYFFGGTPAPASGVGDQALRATDTDNSVVMLLARRANVIVKIRYTATGKVDESSVDNVTAAARAVVDSVKVD